MGTPHGVLARDERAATVSFLSLAARPSGASGGVISYRPPPSDRGPEGLVPLIACRRVSVELKVLA
jgi:hypothetical protein